MTVGGVIKSRVASLGRTLILKANYALHNYGEVVWLVADGRSGTTWVCDLINHGQAFRELFEPFHPRLVHDMSFLEPHQYVRPHESHDELLDVASDVFYGKFIHPRVDSNNNRFLYKGLLVKDIFANLFCCWATRRFPTLKPVLLIRNPFAVAASKRRTKHWGWATDPLDLLNQASLHEDYLQPFEDLIRKTSAENDYLLNQILTWSIINSVPLRQFSPGSLHICFYEDVCMDPRGEISRLLRFVRDRDCEVDLPKDVIDRPSRSTLSNAGRPKSEWQLTSWRNELPSFLIDAGLALLEQFGLEELYDERSIPNRKVLDRLHNTSH